MQEIDVVRSTHFSPALNSPATSPADGSEMGLPLIGLIYSEMASSEQISPTDRNGTFWHSDTDHEDTVVKRFPELASSEQISPTDRNGPFGIVTEIIRTM